MVSLFRCLIGIKILNGLRDLTAESNHQAALRCHQGLDAVIFSGLGQHGVLVEKQVL